VIERLELTPYRLPLNRPWQSARGLMGERAGWLVCAHSGGLRGYGDCAPLAAAGTETPQRALAALEVWRRATTGQSLGRAVALVSADRSPAPAARFAVESALLDLAARFAGTPLRRWLDPRAADRVRVNAALGALAGVSPELLHASCAAGFGVLKVKVGLGDPGEELDALAGLARQLPRGAVLRLDANGAWSLEEALRVVGGLNLLPVESLEEPLRDPRPASLRRLQSIARFPIALDETLHGPGGNIASDGGAVRRVVLKPAVLGGLCRTLRFARMARARGVQVVVTSLVETAAGIWPTLQLAAALPSTLAHGLATSGWLDRDLGAPPLVNGGCIVLPGRPGSGFCPKGSDGGRP
jgi:o-succinylbenzoate synthase